MNYIFRKAKDSDSSRIWEILKLAISRRKADGSNQWQDGYPNPQVVHNDIKTGTGYVLAKGKSIIGYCALLINNEPEYDNIEGEWLTHDDFVVFHRVAISEKYLGQGFAKEMLNYIEQFAFKNKIKSIKADTNFDNIAMLKIFEQSGYTFCGEVYFRGSPRKAYEKVLHTDHKTKSL